MAVTANTITSAKVCRAPDIDFVNSFTEEFNRLFELLGMFPIETAPAGAAINQYTVTGTLGSAPAEGDVTRIPLQQAPAPFIHRLQDTGPGRG